MVDQDIATAPSESQLRNLVDRSGFGMLVTDQQGNIVYANPRFCETSGCSLDDLRGRNSRIFQSCQVEPSVHPVENRYAAIDELTGLPNQDSLIDTLSEVLSRSQDDGAGFSLFSLEIDDFNSICATLGASEIDALLKELVKRISAAVRAGDLMAYCGPGRFAVVLKGTLDKNVCTETARRILQRIAQPIGTSGRNVGITGSIGIARYPLDAGSANDLLHASTHAQAEACMPGGERLRFFAPEVEPPPRR
jgi:diguanylate cyclase (GGDEF)-like protein